MTDWTLGIGAVGALAIAAVAFAFFAGWILKTRFEMSKNQRKWGMIISAVYAGIVVVTAGWLGMAADTSTTGAISPIDAEYDVGVTDSLSHVAVNELTNTVTVLLDRNTTAWESATQYVNLSFALTRIDAGTADSTVVFDVSGVDSWVETSGLTYYTLQRYSSGDFYADWNEYGSATTVNDKISIMIDRSTESSARANLSMVADLSAWLLESVGDSHTITITLSDPASGFSDVWTVNFILQNAT